MSPLIDKYQSPSFYGAATIAISGYVIMATLEIIALQGQGLKFMSGTSIGFTIGGGFLFVVFTTIALRQRKTNYKIRSAISLPKKVCYTIQQVQTAFERETLLKQLNIWKVQAEQINQFSNREAETNRDTALVMIEAIEEKVAAFGSTKQRLDISLDSSGEMQSVCSSFYFDFRIDILVIVSNPTKNHRGAATALIVHCIYLHSQSDWEKISVTAGATDISSKYYEHLFFERDPKVKNFMCLKGANLQKFLQKYRH